MPQIRYRFPKRFWEMGPQANGGWWEQSKSFWKVMSRISLGGKRLSRKSPLKQTT